MIFLLQIREQESRTGFAQGGDGWHRGAGGGRERGRRMNMVDYRPKTNAAIFLD
jgi:hypothetical protein